MRMSLRFIRSSTHADLWLVNGNGMWCGMREEVGGVCRETNCCLVYGIGRHLYYSQRLTTTGRTDESRLVCVCVAQAGGVFWFTGL